MEENAVADSSKDLQLRELKDMINDLKKMIKTLQWVRNMAHNENCIKVIANHDPEIKSQTIEL